MNKSWLVILISVVIVVGVWQFRNRYKTAAAANPDFPTNIIHLGVFSSLTGPAEQIARMENRGVQLAVRDANGQNQGYGFVVNPRSDSSEKPNHQVTSHSSYCKIQLVSLDDGSTGDGIVRVLQRIYDNDCRAIVGEAVSSRILGSIPSITARGIPMITPAATNVHVTKDAQGRTYSCVFRMCYTDEEQATFLVNELQRVPSLQKCKRALVFYFGLDKYSEGLVWEIKNAAGNRLAVKSEPYAEYETDFSKQIKRGLARIKPDVIFAIGYYCTITPLVHQLRHTKGLVSVPIIGGDAWDSPTLFEGYEKDFRNTFYSTHYFPPTPIPNVTPVPSPFGTEPFVNEFTKAFGVPPNAFAALGFDTVNLLIRAVQYSDTNNPTSSQLRDAIEADHFTDGTTGSVVFDKKSHDPVKTPVFLEFNGSGYQPVQ